MNIQKQFTISFVIYGLNTLLTLFLYWKHPEHRAYLEIYLIATVGPILAQSHFGVFRKRGKDLPYRWVQRLKVPLLVLTAFFAIRAFREEQSGIYIYLLLMMGPILITTPIYAAHRALALQKTETLDIDQKKDGN